VPSMLVCMLAYVMCRRFNLYQMQLPSHLEAPNQMSNMATAVLQQMTVGQALAGKPRGSVSGVPRNARFSEVLSRFLHSAQSCLPVVDDHEGLTGVIETRDVRRVMCQPGFEAIVIASDLEIPATTLTAEDTLLTAISRMVASRSDELVVVAEDDPHKITGTIGRGDIIAAYDRQLLCSVSSS